MWLFNHFKLNLLSDFLGATRVEQQTLFIDYSCHFKIFLRYFALKETYQGTID